MITTLSHQAGRKYPQFGNTSSGLISYLPDAGNTTPFVAPVIVNLSGGGKVLSWEEALLEAVKKRELERGLQNKAVELKQVVKKIQKTKAKVKKAKPQQVDGILANLWKLEERKEELKLQVQTFQQRIEDIEILLLAANKAKQEEEEDEQEIELLLLQ